MWSALVVRRLCLDHGLCGSYSNTPPPITSGLPTILEKSQRASMSTAKAEKKHRLVAPSYFGDWIFLPERYPNQGSGLIPNRTHSRHVNLSQHMVAEFPIEAHICFLRILFAVRIMRLPELGSTCHIPRYRKESDSS